LVNGFFGDGFAHYAFAAFFYGFFEKVFQFFGVVNDFLDG
jgi:hypothetical protein